MRICVLDNSARKRIVRGNNVLFKYRTLYQAVSLKGKPRMRTRWACLNLMSECSSKMKRSLSPVELLELEKRLAVDWQVLPAKL